MTFEEFFVKKKIDLNALAKAEPELFSEFKSHYNLMGERSFDHTKKFWFNKLRRLYHLSTAEKAITQLETKIASQAEPLSSPTIEQKPAPLTEAAEPAKTVAKPAFKPRNIPVKAEEKKEEAPVAENTTAASPAKKPGFKPRNIKPADREAEDAKSLESRPGKTEVSDTPITNLEQAGEDAAKPAYKPKFNMRNVPRNPGGATEQTGDSREEKLIPEPEENAVKEPDADSPKPAYKPKFNLKNIAKAKAEDNTTDSVEDQAGDAVTPASEQQTENAPKPAYKPKFNMKNLPQQKAEEKVEDKGEISESQSSAANIPASDPIEESTPVKPAYKPRFNMKNLPKGKSEEGSTAESEKTEEIKAEESKESEAPKEDQETPAAKPAYKPRFNMRNIKPKPSEDSE